MPDQVRPTKKQRELLSYIQKFVAEHGYGPSYREIMSGVGYSSPATVALHVNNLVARGHLRKSGRSARSIEVIDEVPIKTKVPTNQVSASEEKWLVEKIEHKFSEAEGGSVTESDIDALYVLVGALKVLGLHGAASTFVPRLKSLKQK